MLIVVRHGRTDANASGLLLGHLDPPLDEVGCEQAAAAALAVGPVHRVVSSPLRRARETAAFFEGPLVEDRRFIELDYGELDGLPLGEVPAEVWQRWRADREWAPEGGESLRSLGDRVGVALDELAVEARTATIVVVTHVSPIKAAVRWALGVEEELSWRLFVGQASVTRIAVTDRGPMLQSFNDTSHLAG